MHVCFNKIGPKSVRFEKYTATSLHAYVNYFDILNVKIIDYLGMQWLYILRCFIYSFNDFLCG